MSHLTTYKYRLTIVNIILKYFLRVRIYKIRDRSSSSLFFSSEALASNFGLERQRNQVFFLKLQKITFRRNKLSLQQLKVESVAIFFTPLQKCEYNLQHFSAAIKIERFVMVMDYKESE